MVRLSVISPDESVKTEVTQGFISLSTTRSIHEHHQRIKIHGVFMNGFVNCCGLFMDAAPEQMTPTAGPFGGPTEIISEPMN
jgi:hypothetical protein